MGLARASFLAPFLALLLLLTGTCAFARSHRHNHRMHIAFFRHHGGHRIAKMKQESDNYPHDYFVWAPPAAAQEHLSKALADMARNAFQNGTASSFSPAALVSAGTFTEDPLKGGIFERRDPVQYIILHSTETGRPADAQLVIKSWNRGLRHPGAQYIVDRDGTIYQTVDPKFATSHVDTRISLFGVNNSNSVGIEMVRSGKQAYTQDQLDSVTHLVVYLQQRFHVSDDHIMSHHQVQPSDRFDPVNFDWTAFHTAAADLRNRTTAADLRNRTTAVSRD